jgi:hypothetical protein
MLRIKLSWTVRLKPPAASFALSNASLSKRLFALADLLGIPSLYIGADIELKKSGVTGVEMIWMDRIV